MNKLLQFFVSVILFAAPMAANAVTWNFYETGCVADTGTCIVPPQPVVLASLTLPGPDSSGEGMWDSSQGPALPVYKGDSFTLSWPAVAPGVSPAFTGTLGCMPKWLCDFDISWSEVAGQLAAVSVTVDGFTDGIEGLGLTFGRVGTFDTLGGCKQGECEVTGFWQSDLAVPVPEPMSAVLLMTGLLGACLASRSRLSAS